MSAFIVDKELILYLIESSIATSHWETFVRILAEHVRSGKLPVSALRRLAEVSGDLKVFMANLLWETNVRAVRWRYPDSVDLPGPPPPWEITAQDLASITWAVWEPVQALKAVQCYEYQCSDWPMFEFTLAYKFTSSLIRRIIQFLPGWEKAEWGAPEPVRKEVR